MNMVIALIFLIFIFYLFYNAKLEDFEEFKVDRELSLRTSIKPSKLKFKRCETLEIPKVEENVIKNFTREKGNDWDIFYPCGYTYVEKELQDNDLFKKKEKGWVMAIDGADNFAAKDRLWSILMKRYGRLRSQIFVPETWVTYNPMDMQLFKKQAKKNPGRLYIMKKNIQRQEGLHLFVNPDEAESAFSKDYVVIQQVLGNPYLVKGRKINLRVYILITCHQGAKKLYVFNDGFIYYSKALYVNGTTRDEVITTGYVDRKVYDSLPLTYKDLQKHITSKNPLDASKLTDLRNTVLIGLMDAFSDSFCSVASNVTYAQTFGVDMQPNQDLTDMKIIEINKAADLSAKDVRDGNLKQAMTDGVYRVLNIDSNGKDSGFEKIWEKM